MNPPSFFDRLRSWIGSLAYSVYLWSVQMTEEQHVKEMEREGVRYQFSADGIRAMTNDPRFYFERYLNDVQIHNIVSFLVIGMSKHNLAPLDLYDALCLAAKLYQAEQDERWNSEMPGSYTAYKYDLHHHQARLDHLHHKHTTQFHLPFVHLLKEAS